VDIRGALGIEVDGNSHCRAVVVEYWATHNAAVADVPLRFPILVHDVPVCGARYVRPPFVSVPQSGSHSVWTCSGLTTFTIVTIHLGYRQTPWSYWSVPLIVIRITSPSFLYNTLRASRLSTHCRVDL
jgi:hypothetical protein